MNATINQFVHNPRRPISKGLVSTRPTIFVAGLCAAILLWSQLANAQSGTSLLKGFNVSNATIPVKDILSGGPPRDGIPSIDQPRFVPASRVNYLQDDDKVISVTVGERTRAYPLRILVWHEIVNDTFGGQAVAVTYCPLCGTAMVFDRKIGSRVLSFGVSGLLYQSDVLMYDRQTESLWSQLATAAVAGPLVRTPLRWLPGEHLTWAAWKQEHPSGEVLAPDTRHPKDYTRTPYQGYEQTEGTMFPVPKYRQEFANKTWVLGVLIAGQAKAYPVDRLPSNAVISDIVGGVNIQVTFVSGSRRPSVIDVDNSVPVPHVMVYWFAWQAFYPQTQIWNR